MKRILKLLLIIFLILITGLAIKASITYFKNKENRLKQQQVDLQIDQLLFDRKTADLTEKADPFGDDNKIKILLLGVDSRVSDKTGHCDAIQFIEIDKNYKTITITAVPRGTYSPLPGTGHLPSDYYLSNACGVVGLEYGIEQIEKTLGQKADYIAIVGFSQAMGIFRELKLPTTETLQWLRNRQGFAIGEPQRAHNHSTFIKQMLIKYLGEEDSDPNKVWQYIIYKMLKTDLSFQQVQDIVKVVSAFDLAKNAGQINTLVKPEPTVKKKVEENQELIEKQESEENTSPTETPEDTPEQEEKLIIMDIYYDQENLEEQLDKLLIKHTERLPEGDFSGLSEQEMQTLIMKQIQLEINNSDFTKQAYENEIWLQIEDDNKRNGIHYELLTKYLELFDDNELEKQIISDYIINMQVRELTDWENKGKDLLGSLLE
ncbi:hypothetical protein HN858_04395 [Candidatus Falkowbacteria bacterium]|jgi:hypothetical protein|nr:hypothetical protein [Candidatus Falkowbacteria bacterium]MBT5502859.1 hypothetical protein [Candidatus Falkowbacteria bacterium]MBT6574610.1 hypothetical protein [Candidatus Falkowbacteria bacterium]MBT7348886.1 hypothetical protein [Candidatus Falkowbacteria bacterium]MBT7501037.1 hypothetical protein [Candidatus Falkowbacteria bacterium]